METSSGYSASQPTRKLRIGIFGHYGNDNLGDEAITAAAAHQLKMRFPDCELVGFSLNPASTAQRHGIQTYPIRRTTWDVESASANLAEAEAESGVSGSALREALKRVPVISSIIRWCRDAVMSIPAFFSELSFFRVSYGRVKDLDIFVVAGSNQIEDSFGGSFGYPYTVWKWTKLARTAGIPIAFASVGASPMASSLSRYFCRSALERAVYRSFRDVSSKKVVESLGVKGENLVAPDFAFSLPQTAASRAVRIERLKVALNPMPYLDRRYWPEDEAHETGYQDYVDVLASFCLWLTEQGHEVLLFPTQLSTDVLVMRDVLQSAIDKSGAEKSAAIQPQRVGGIDDVFEVLRGADIVVATRFHAVLFGQLACLPVIAVSYQQKIDDLMSAAEQSPYCLKIANVTLPSLQTAFARIIRDQGNCRARIGQQVQHNQSLLARQYDRLVEIARSKQAPDAAAPGTRDN